MADIILLADKLKFAGVHAALLKTGNVLFFSSIPPVTKTDPDLPLGTNMVIDGTNENNIDQGYSQIFNPNQGPQTRIKTKRNLFCSGHCFLPNGKLLITAGQSNNHPLPGSPLFANLHGADHDIHTYNERINSFERHKDMPAARYYPTCVTLPDGNALIISGAYSRGFGFFPQINHTAETFYWKDQYLGYPIQFNTPEFIKHMYPFVQILPHRNNYGNLFVFSGNKAKLYSLNTSSWMDDEFECTSEENRNYPNQGSCIVLPFMADDTRIKIMIIGGGRSDESDQAGHDHSHATVALDTAEIFEYRTDRPKESFWINPITRMNKKRFMGDAVHLFNGKILLINGAGEGEADDSARPVLEAEEYDPETKRWEITARLNHDRMYHSTALLLPSGEVLIAGNTQNWNPKNQLEDRTLELYIPDYINKERPKYKFNTTKKTFDYDQPIEITSYSKRKIVKAAIIRCGSTTHTNNMDQRFIYVPFTSDNGQPEKIIWKPPFDSSIAPPGHYMFITINEEGIPSPALIRTIGPNIWGYERIINETGRVYERDGWRETEITIEPNDQIEFSASGSIWAGHLRHGENGPEGIDEITTDHSYPLHNGASAFRYSLIGRFGSGSSEEVFYIGSLFTKRIFYGRRAAKIWLRTNDDLPGNGHGYFSCRIQIWRRQWQ